MSTGSLPSADAPISQRVDPRPDVALQRAGAPPSLGTLDGRRLEPVVRALARKVAQLQFALDSRVVIEQAKGVLAERYSVSTDAAFVVLRGAARSDRMDLHDLAAQVVASRSTPPCVEAEWRRRSR